MLCKNHNKNTLASIFNIKSRRLKALQATEAYTNDYEYIIQMIIVMYT